MQARVAILQWRMLFLARPSQDKTRCHQGNDIRGGEDIHDLLVERFVFGKMSTLASYQLVIQPRRFNRTCKVLQLNTLQIEILRQAVALDGERDETGDFRFSGAC